MYFGPAVADRFAAVWGAFSAIFWWQMAARCAKLALVGKPKFSFARWCAGAWNLPACSICLPKPALSLCSQPGGRDVSPELIRATFMALSAAVNQLPCYHLLVDAPSANRR
ncbi:MAG: hypothetical protein H6662_02835 [Ardenticatenaceae bacterium]|nr:hypothetical protein [Ardenticatenaceae bacterium]